MSSYSEHIDIYCERTDAGFWAEPLNALTNFAFILAAIFLLAYWRQKRGNNSHNWQIQLLIILTAIVGLGSFMFHTFATRWSMLMDIIPIIILIHFAIYVIFNRIGGLKWWKALLGLVGFTIFNVLVLKIFGREMLNGSMQYVPTLIFLIATTAYTQAKRIPVSKEFLIAAGAFVFSITCRSIDMAICEDMPLGVHFMWHTMNAVTIYFVGKGLIKAGRKA